MDRLTRDVLAAQKRGLSYGKYMGLKYEAEQKAREAAEPQAMRRGKRGHCAVCGMLIPPASKSSKYCCQECARKAQKEIKADPGAERHCRICGNIVKNKRRKYCCPECADVAHRQQMAASKMRARQSWRKE